MPALIKKNQDCPAHHERRKEELLKQVDEHEAIIIQRDDIIRIFNKLSTRKAAGLDKISALFLRKIMSDVTHPLYHNLMYSHMV